MNLLLRLYFGVAGLYALHGANHQPRAVEQKFRNVIPLIKAKVGDDVLLPCEIENPHGAVQWVKDGMTLGYEEKIMGMPTYEMRKNQKKGDFSLKITNATLEDDASFECQIGPKIIGEERFSPNRIHVKLIVLVPPQSIQMTDIGNNSIVAAPQNEDFKLQCVAKGSRPNAEIVWYRNEIPLQSGQPLETSACVTKAIRSNTIEVCDVVSTLTLKPTLLDDSMNYSCRAVHEALPSEKPMITSITLRIIYPPPDPPQIEGNVDGDKTVQLSEGEMLELTCRSLGGWPLAKLNWYKGSARLPATSYVTRELSRMSESKLKINLEANDNGEEYSCKSINSALNTSLKKSVKLSVSFGPVSLTLSGPDEANTGQMITLQCTTSTSNPVANVVWVVDGQMQPNSSSAVSESDYRGWIRTSWLNVVVPAERKELLIYCYANNARASKSITANKTIHIHYPPSVPVISGYTRGSYVPSGMRQDLICTSSGGNPLAELTWYKNNQKILPVVKKNDKTSSFAEISVIASKIENGAIYRCEAKNPTMPKPYETSIRLNVYFPPEHVTVDVRPPVVSAGTIAKLHCNCSSSNPPAEITWWWNNTYQMREGISNFEKEGPYGGNLTFSELTINATADMHENKFTCRVLNPFFEPGISVPAEMNVLYKPTFMDRASVTNISKNEGETLTVSFEAKGNPTSIIYRWLKDGKPWQNSVSGASLTIFSLKRSHSGVYTCEAENSEGADQITFVLDVKYEASIEFISKNVVVSNGSSAELKCRVKGHPIEADFVSWNSHSNVINWEKRRILSFQNNTLILKLANVTQLDMGVFTCVVFNGIGAEKNETTFLIVEHAPASNLTSQIIKIAPNNNGSATFVCHGSGAPKLEFLWFKEATLLENVTSSRVIEDHRINELNYTSILRIKKVHSKDYGRYQCTVKNKIGLLNISYELSNPSVPDPPTNLRVVNVTLNTITLTWDLYFDGGDRAEFRVRYYAINNARRQVRSKDTADGMLTIGTLLPDTTYVFDVMAWNRRGGSNYSTTLNVTTLSDSNSVRTSVLESTQMQTRFFIVIASGGVVILILINVLILILCFRKCSKQTKEALSLPNKSVEMFNSGAMNSMHAEKPVNFSHSDNNRNHINEEQTDIPLPYVIEDINYPFMENSEYHLPRRQSSEEKFCKPLPDGYSTISHVHHLRSPPFFCDSHSTSNIAHAAAMDARRRTSMSHLLNLGVREESPTPSLPPPMTSISTHAYRSLQPSNYLHL